MKIQDHLLKHPKVGTPSPLVVGDLAKLHEGGRSIGAIKRLRASHHKIARLAAWGFKNKEIAAHTGYTRERVGQLLGSPAMKELVAKYMEKVEEREAENADAYLTTKFENMMAAERHIADHFAELDEEGELMPVATALKVSADAADRLGFAKRQVIQHNHAFAAELEKAIRRSGKVINSVAVQPKLIPASTQSNNSGTSGPSRSLIERRI